MRQFIYEPSVIGLTEWPSGTLRLEDVEITTDPRQADVFVFPGGFLLFETEKDSGIVDRDKLVRLPHYVGNESRHVFLDISDNFKKKLHLPIMLIRCDQRAWMRSSDPNTINMPWPVEDYSECVELPDGGFKYDVSFQGWYSTTVREVSAKACLASSLKCDIQGYPNFCGYIFDKPEGIRRRAEFRRSMRESRVMLCGESIEGVFPYRFWEAMSAGRVPALIGSDFTFPFADEIPYEDFCIFIPRMDAQLTPQVIQEFIATHSDAEIIEIGRLGRRHWEQFLNTEHSPRLHAYLVRKQLAKMGVSA